MTINEIRRRLCISVTATALACTSVAGSERRPAPDPEQNQLCGVGPARAGHVGPEIGPAGTLTLTGLGPHPTVHPAPDTVHYAAAKRWYLSDNVVVVGGRRYAKFGWPLAARPSQSGDQGDRVVRIGEFDGVPVYARPPLDPYPRFVVLQLNAACQFQPYAEASEVQ